MSYLKERFSKKTWVYWMLCGSALLALVCLIMFASYQGQGGAGSAADVITCLVIGIAAHIALFFYDGKFGDFVAVLPACLYAYGGLSALGGGVGNIADMINGIVCFGIPELAPMTIAMGVIGMVAAVIAVVGCFFTRDKTED